MTGLPASVTILGLASGTLSSSAVFPASQTTNGVATTIGVPLSQLMSTGFGTLPTGGGTGQLLSKSGGTNFVAVWSNLSSFVAGTTGGGIAVTGSTSLVVAFTTVVGLSVLGVGTTATAVPAPIPGTAGQVLRVNDAGTGLAFGAVNLATSAAVTGILPSTNITAIDLAATGPGGIVGVLPLSGGGLNTTTLTPFGIVYGAGTSTVGITAAGTAFWPLLGNNATTAPSFQLLNLTASVTGILGLANGGTNGTTQNAAALGLGSWQILGASAVATSATGTTSEITLATITIPANAMRPNGIVRITSQWDFNTSGNNKTMRVKFNGSAIWDSTATSQGYVRNQTQFSNRNATNLQVASASNGVGGFGVVSGASVTTAFDTTTSLAVALTGTLGSTSDTLTLSSYVVELAPQS